MKNKATYLPKSLLLQVIFSLVVALAVSGLATTSVSALSGNEFKAGRIIDDVVFNNDSSMSAEQIQNFLNSKVPTCDTNGSQAYAGTTRASYGTSRGYPPPYTCLKDYSQNIPSVTNGGSDLCKNSISGGTKSAARIIIDVAKACNINPQVLIVLLQKEQSLITDDWPWSIQYRSATGYGCPDTAPCDSEYYGFFNQVYQAAKAYRRYEANPANYNYRSGRNNTIFYHPDLSRCGNSNVYIENQATAGLYIYTPYRPNQAALNNLYGTGDSCSSYGNRNFWRMFNDWFGPTLTNTLPGGASLLRESSTGRIYLAAEGKKYLVPSWNYMVAYRLDKIGVQSVSTSQLSGLSDMGRLTSLIRDASNGRIDLVDGGNRYWVRNPSVCNDWALDCFNSSALQSLPDYLIYWLFDKGNLKPLVREPNGIVYEVKDGEKLPLYSPTTMSDLGYTWNDVGSLQPQNTNYPLGVLRITHPAVLKFSPSPDIFYFDGTEYNRVASMPVLKAWNFDKQLSSPPTSSLNSTPPTSESSISIFSQIGSTKYVVNGGVKYSLSTEQQTLWPDASYQTNTADAASKLSTKTLKEFIRVSPRMYIIDEDQKRYVPTLTDLKALGFNGSNFTSLDSYSADMIAQGPNALGSGALVRLVGDSKIYVLSNDSLHYITGPTIFKDFGFSWSNVRSINSSVFDAYTVSDNLSNFVESSSGFSYFYKNSQVFIPKSYYADEFGLKSSYYEPVNARLTSFRDKKTIKRFLRNASNGAIYYGSGGALHYVSSMDSYKRYGGTSSNLMTVGAEFINSFNIGQPI